MSIWVGLSGAAGQACVAVRTSSELLGICEQERITRCRGAGFNPTGLPDEALDAILDRAGRTRDEISSYSVVTLADGHTPAHGVPMDAHRAHAQAAFAASPFDAATVVVCDDEAPYVSVWKGSADTVANTDWAWHGPGPANIYSECAAILGFVATGRQQRMEALARLTPWARDSRADGLFRLSAKGLHVAPDWANRMSDWLRSAGPEGRGIVAASVQARLADCLIELLRQVRDVAPSTAICLTGRLFANSYFNSRLKLEAGYEDVFVPVSPGVAGLALGAALTATNPARLPITAFHGPTYSGEEIKAFLDNCKLTYRWASEGEVIGFAVESLHRGRLVALYEGPMEWGPRALGARSIIANPFAPYALDNLNRFLKQRDSWRGYALSCLETSTGEHFEGPSSSPFMECDYTPRTPHTFRHILPRPDAAVRVQTVGASAPTRFQTLLQEWGKSSGIPVVVNTSFNAFREPIVCNPRDAIRVFFGSGADALILGPFIVEK